MTERQAVTTEKISLDDMLAGRRGIYGAFEHNAKTSQALKAVMHEQSGWDRLSPDQREALEMIQHKIARILNGDPDYLDSWVDIAGYAQLVADRLQAAAALKCC